MNLALQQAYAKLQIEWMKSGSSPTIVRIVLDIKSDGYHFTVVKSLRFWNKNYFI